MDWFSWMSKTGLDPSLVYDYALSFSQNELEEDDISYFNHEFLQSMGISIAKHRLQILKLARKQISAGSPSRFMIALKRTKRCFSKYLLRPPWARRQDSSSLALVPHSARYYKGAMLRRNVINRRIAVGSKSARAPLLLTNGSPMFFQSSRMESFSSLMGEDHSPLERNDKYDDDEYWSSAVEQDIRWDTMFQNLKPT